MANILLAEDDRNFGMILKTELEEEEHTVHHVIDGVEAILSYIANLYDFVLLDLRMPRLTGTDALRIMKSLNPGVRAITFSGNAGQAEMAESLNCGAVKCFTKPFEITHLKEIINNMFPKGLAL
jgi:two-component system response regulator (stage 0 sporulation protein F)